MPVANVCPHCDALVPVKQEHMYMRTRKVDVPEVQEAVPARRAVAERRPGAADREAGVRAFELGRNFANKLWNAARFLLHEPGRLHARRRSTWRSCRSRTAGS